MLFAALAICSCSESDDTLLGDEPSGEAKIIFAAHPDLQVTAGTRAAASDLVSGGKFTFYAFKKGQDGNYAFEKKLHDEAAVYSDTEKHWRSNKALLPVGTYRFLSFYNLLGEVESLPGEETMKEWGSRSWNAVLDGIVIEHLSDTKDVDEFFCSASDEDIQIAGANGNSIVVGLGVLKRVVSRIDVKFVKVAKNDPVQNPDLNYEVCYDNDSTIFGAKGDLKTIQLRIDGLSKKYSLGVEPSSNVWGKMTEFSFLDPIAGGLVVFGEKISAGIGGYPNPDGSDVNKVTEMKAKISRGGAYFRGAYVLPFMSTNKFLEKLQIDLSGKDNAERLIVVTGGATTLQVRKNYVTLVTVKLMSNTEAGDLGDNKEHLFNPKLKFTVSVSDLYDGVDNSDVPVE